MILAKCCHDMDLLYWLIGSHCKSISSFGSLTYFKESNAPEGAPARCLDGCPHSDTCPYYAPHVYINGPHSWMRDAACSSVCTNPTPEQVVEILKTSPYGRCVFHCDNDVVDHQVANLSFENGATVTFSMCAFTSRIDRTLKIMGTKGELLAIMSDGIHGQDTIEIRDFETASNTFYYPKALGSGHGGGDTGIMLDFVRLLRGEKTSTSLTDISVSAESHALAFAAEASRLSGKTIDMGCMARFIIISNSISVAMRRPKRRIAFMFQIPYPSFYEMFIVIYKHKSITFGYMSTIIRHCSSRSMHIFPFFTYTKLQPKQ